MVLKVKVCDSCHKSFSTTNNRRRQCARCRKEKKQKNWKQTLNRLK